MINHSIKMDSGDCRIQDPVPAVVSRVVIQSAPVCVCYFACVLVVVLTGCRSTTGTREVNVDRRIQRSAEAASVAFREGDLDEAIEEYRKAIRRAWAIDDPQESGTNAYNLAACMVTLGRYAEAKDWLMDARIEMDRGNAWSGNTWLLEAKIAQHECRFADAERYIRHAACAKPPCVEKDREVLCGPGDPCKESCLSGVPFVGKKVQEREATEDCRNAYDAQIHFARARVAAEQFDVINARKHYLCGCELASGVCDDGLLAESHNVAAYVHLAKGEYLQAGVHFDREAVHLRLSGNYREIPGTLELAAAAYEQSERFGLAANRLCRVARIYFGRGLVEKSWGHLRRAVELAELACNESVRIRLALLANEIQRSLDESSSSAPLGDLPTDAAEKPPTSKEPPQRGQVLRQLLQRSTIASLGGLIAREEVGDDKPGVGDGGVTTMRLSAATLSPTE